MSLKEQKVLILMKSSYSSFFFSYEPFSLTLAAWFSTYDKLKHILAAKQSS